MRRLDQAPWLTDPDAGAVMAALAVAGGPEAARFVGGCVRDALLGREVGDVDVATVLTPDQVVAALGRAGLRAVPTGIAHGTVTAVSGRRPFEITTLRRDVSTDGRRATVAFTDDWTEDARRRDFHLNALYADMAGTLFDPTGRGVDDALAGRIVFVGEARRRIDEDHLRILRFFRFFSWYGRGEPDAEALTACADRVDGLGRLSAERVSHELLRLLAAPDPTRAVDAMAATGALAAVLGPEADPGRLRALVPHADDPVLRLSTLLPDDPPQAEARARALRLSNAMVARLRAAAPPLAPGDRTARRMRALAYAEGVEAVRDRALKAGAVDLAAEIAGWTPPRLPVGGREVAWLGVPPGPETGAVLAAFERGWIADDFDMDDVEGRLATAVRAVRASTR